MDRARRHVLLLPGIDGSGDAHWQRLWAARHPEMEIVEQRDWHLPCRAEWVATLDDAVAETGEDTVLVAHSLGCLLVAHWAARSRARIAGALLVAPPAAGNAALEQRAQGFFPVPGGRLPFPAMVVASRDDPYASIDQSRAYAMAWGASLVDIGNAGHINACSGIGIWPFGLELLAWTIAIPGGCRRVA